MMKLVRSRNSEKKKSVSVSDPKEAYEKLKSFFRLKNPCSLEILSQCQKWTDLKDAWVCDWGIYTENHLRWIQKNITSESEFQKCRFQGQLLQDRLSEEEKKEMCFLTFYEQDQPVSNTAFQPTRTTTTHSDEVKFHPQLSQHQALIKKKYSLLAVKKDVVTIPTTNDNLTTTTTQQLDQVDDRSQNRV
jgi:hypothetical protein